MATEAHVIVPGSERQLLPGSKALGLANPTETIEITVKVRRKAPLPALTSRPAAPLSRSEMAAKYGAAASDMQAVQTALGQYELKVIGEDPATRSIEFAGTVAEIERAFQVKLFRYHHERGEYRGRSGTIQVPAGLDGIIVGVYGLDNRRVIRRRRRKGQASPQGTAHALATTTRRGFLPSDLAKLYDFPDGDGDGQTIGILEFGGGVLPDDLELFCRKAGVGVPNVLPLSVDHAPTDTDDGAAGEVMLDVEVVAGICPKATVPVYFGPGFDERSWIDTITRAIHDQQNQPTILSISWGAPEEDVAWSQGAIDHVNHLFQEAAMMGVTVCVASGDDGSADETDQAGDAGQLDGKAHVDFPASSPFVLAVGGTDLRVGLSGPTEKTWKDGNGRRQFPGGTGTGGSTGGGVSAHFPRPAFQSAIKIASVNPGSIAGRVVPDVAAHAQSDGRTTGYFMILDGNGFPNGGTSAAAPLWAALIGRINAVLENEKGPGKRAGYLTPILYQKGADDKPIGATSCKDITIGDNISAHVGGYSAGPGFDAVTGWGSPIGSKLLAALRLVV